MSSNWDWQTLYRDFWNRPLGTPFLAIYSQIMNIRRYDKMPFYFAPVGTHVVDYEDKIINFVDYLVDAHEEARNPMDKNRNFYQRTNYVIRNFLRY